MKKLIYLSLIVGCLNPILAQNVPTCSLDPVFTGSNKYGIWPDSATNFNSGFVNNSYLQNITVKVPKDTLQSILKLCFTRFVVSTPSNVVNYGLPPGLNFASSTSVVVNGTVNGAPSLRFPGNANNCASVYGTPTVTGTYTLQIQIQAYATTTLSIAQCPAVPNYTSGLLVNTTFLKYYKININQSTLLSEQQSVFPIRLSAFHSWIENTTATEQSLSIFSLSGQLLSRIQLEPHEIRYQAMEGLPSGIYMLKSENQGSSTFQKIIRP